MDKSSYSIIMDAIERPAILIDVSKNTVIYSNKAFTDGDYPDCFCSPDCYISYDLSHLDTDYRLCLLDTDKTYLPFMSAHLDKSTGLYTRETFETLVMCHLSEDYTADHAMIFIKICNFGDIEASCGAEFSEKFNEYTAVTVKKLMRGNDPISHFNKDTFAVLACNVYDSSFLKSRMEELLRKVSLDFKYGGKIVSANCRIGIALLKGTGITISDAFREASNALSKADDSQTGYVVFNGEEKSSVN